MKSARYIIAASLLTIAHLATSQAPPQSAGPECAGMPKLRAAKLPNPSTVIRSAMTNAAPAGQG